RGVRDAGLAALGYYAPGERRASGALRALDRRHDRGLHRIAYRAPFEATWPDEQSAERWRGTRSARVRDSHARAHRISRSLSDPDAWRRDDEQQLPWLPS